MGPDVVAEGVVLTLDAAAVGGDETVGHGACRRHSVLDAREYVRGGGAAGYDGRLGAIYRSPGTVCPPGAEFAYRTVGRPAYPGRLGRDRHLVVHYAEHWGFQDLSLDKGGLHRDYRLVREDYLSLPHDIYVSGEFHLAEIVAELAVLISREELPEELLVRLAEVAHHLYHFLSAADHGPVIVFRSFPVEQVENRLFIFPSRFVEGFSHRVLVLV